ncbi:hypothetical protein N480_21080 [Pseudoalteromonas luteoviolacea S2607]|uniref:hypothetical protein n=1 Tax=Pseudoalteromonas luteoviolacea TaxID=43657 RepID=UPI0007B0B146|nr:hypothetical protein [Pseudoalteromonas luteoviolacea]KZN34521.1 hypothetical protein N480_21080 [Pseudoalteromonas luteoviolacea S2607]
MFSYENFKGLYDLITYMALPIYILSILIGWRNVNFRYLCFLLIAIEVIDTFTNDIAMNWGNGYYIWGMFICLLFIVPVLGRRLITKRLKYFSFFRSAHESYHFTKQEGGLLAVFFISFAIHLITFIEVSLFTFYIIDSYPIRNNIYGPAQTILHVSAMSLILINSFKNRNQMQFESKSTTT